jgi:hypothetical protein
MDTFFDALTVACFVGLIVVFLKFSQRDSGTLWRFVLCGIVLAIANQLGNRGYVGFGAILVVAAIGFGWLSVGRAGPGR